MHHYLANDDLIPPAKAYQKSSSNNSTTSYPHLALEQSADYGHPLAQFYLANAHASGIWPFEGTSSSSSSTNTQLEVLEEWLPPNHPQVLKSFLLWHMAAMAGNIEAAMALAHRMDTKDEPDAKKTTTGPDNSPQCVRSLPYWEAAAHGIMDQLESSPHSRAKAIPHMDKHVLAQVHMHGGTSSQLDWNNKPDESKEAIQFYHLKATTTPWYYKEQKDKPTTIDVTAAATLGHFYHHGIRGVAQNLTLALEYYEIAANNNHWEAAGQAGTFYLWGMG